MTNTELFYNEQYRRIQEGVMHIVMFGTVSADTHTGKHEALNELMFRNTMLLSKITTATKYLILARENNLPMEEGYFKKQLVLHCFDLLQSKKGSIVKLIFALVRRFHTDLIKPPVLKRLMKRKWILICTNRANLPYYNKIKHRLMLMERKGDGMQQYQVLETINCDELIDNSSLFIETYIELNTILIELLEYLNASTNKY